jgi:hypothetical protein
LSSNASKEQGLKTTYISQWPTLNVKVPPEVWATINERAEAQALPTSVIVREILSKALGRS